MPRGFFGSAKNTWLYRSEDSARYMDGPQLIDEVIDDINFMMRTQARLYGAKCINHMLPEFKGNFVLVPDFCPDPQLMKIQKSASTPLLAPIILRMVLIVLLFVDLLRENEDGDKVEGVSHLIYS